ncbi:hypothetical protein HCU01_33390 [Halomonas cupida]|uniref:Putative 3TM holin, Phage_holin_3 n=1 Tax=Halomonas cupida TaxID=44933 RepID=A0A1M7KHC3_9GAMM|nr:phage holin family protein [Halomonas cupida]GEN25390.1 hypothetical protein HCU01_33390 [Halomonas cupida]SHM64712.1 Putative 3TM holin, Phage_holin_3 [Halomonas cupida]
MTFTDIAVVAAVIILLRLITYQRRGSRYRPGIAWLAWLMSCISVIVIVKLPFVALPSPVTAAVAASMGALAILLLRHGGNLAHLLRSLHLIRRH